MIAVNPQTVRELQFNLERSRNLPEKSALDAELNGYEE